MEENNSLLFEAIDVPKSYPDELRAIADDRKAMSYFSSSKRDAFLHEMEMDALRLGLVCQFFDDVRVVGGKDVAGSQLFVCKEENSWRIHAYKNFLKAMDHNGPWSFAAEEYQSFLLGYEAKMIDQWIRFKRKYQMVIGCCTVYMTMEKSQVEKLRLLGNRCLPVGCGQGGEHAYIPRIPSTLRFESLSRMSKGFAIVRFALPWPNVLEIFPEMRNHETDRPLSQIISRENVININNCIRSNVELLV